MTLSSPAKLPIIFLKALQCATLIATLLAGLLVGASSAAEPLKVVVTGHGGTSNSSDPSYFYEQLLVLALEKTRATDGDFILSHNVHRGGIARDRAMVVAGVGLDVMWASATKEREQQMRVVPVDLLKNLNNFRVLMIHKDAQLQFSKVKNLRDLRRFTVGSGEHWTDGKIMKDNGFTVVVTPNYHGLFKMLAARRFNFISRGLHEIGFESQLHEGLALTQEKTLLLKYDTPIRYCFFVNKNNIKLADRLERGLNLAQQDGSFDKLFHQTPSFKEGEEILKSSQRTIIEIKNTKSD